MEPKRPFSLLEWLETPPAVREYIIALEQAFNNLTRQHQKLEERVEKLENRLTRNSRSSNKPPSSDSPFQKGKDKGGSVEAEGKEEDRAKGPEKKESKKKKKRNRGAQKGHKGHKQELLEPTHVILLKPERCSCGCIHFDENLMEPFYTHQQIELPEIKMDLNSTLLF